jgi:hypothetical protein
VRCTEREARRNGIRDGVFIDEVVIYIFHKNK